MPSSNLDRAFELWQSGKAEEAEELLSNAVERAQSKHGAASPKHAAAQFDLASFFASTGDFDRAIPIGRAAAEMRSVDRDTEKDRLTYAMNLGDFLQKAGELEEAKSVLEQNLREREKFYDEAGHPGLAFGLEPLASVLSELGELDAAKESADRAFEIFWNDRHPRTANVMVLRAEIMAKIERGLADRAFEGCAEFPDEMFAVVVDEALERAENVDDPQSFLAVLEAIYTQAETRGADPNHLTRLLAEIAQLAREAGDDEARISAHRSLIGIFVELEDGVQEINALQGLALAMSDAGDGEGANTAYRQAVERAKKLGDRAKLSQVLVNFALHSEDEAEKTALFGEALAAARAAKSDEAIGRALISFGIFEQHGGRLEKARGMLEEALGILDPSEPDTLYARSHLDAIQRSASCGCGDMDKAMSDALRAMVLPQLPEGLLETLALKVEDGGLQLEVTLAREPSDEEVEHMNRVIDEAVTTLQEKIRKSDYV